MKGPLREELKNWYIEDKHGKKKKIEQSLGSRVDLLLNQHDIVSDGRTQSRVSTTTTRNAFRKFTSKPPLKRKKNYDWQKEHLPNLTGTAFAVKPQGSLLDRGFRQKSTADYESWTPKK